MQYSLYEFGVNTESVEPNNKYSGSVAWIVSCYYTQSFDDSADPCGPDDPQGNWRYGLWAVRKKYGKEYADKLLFYALKDNPPVSSKVNTFDGYFFNRINGAEVFINNASDQIHGC